MKRRFVVLLICTLVTNALILGQTWTGNLNNDWNTAGNWSSASVPTNISNVVIPSSLASGNWPVLSGRVLINSITMQSGSQMDLNGSPLFLNSAYNATNSFTGATLNNSSATGIAIIVGYSGIPTIFTYFNNSVVNDDINFTVYGIFQSNTFKEGGNRYNGNATFTFYGGISVFISNTVPSFFNANLTINHVDGNPPDIPGTNMLFNAGATIKGNFILSSNDPGDIYLGSTTNKTIIGGTVNIITPTPNSIPVKTPYIFSMLWLVNQTTGGSIIVQNPLGFNVQNDTLLLTSMSISGYRGSANAYLLNNFIMGDVNIADDASYTGGWGTFVRNNIINGNCSLSNNGTNALYDADSTGTGNKYLGNVTYTQKGVGMSVGAGDFDELSQNLTLSSDAGISLGHFKFNGSVNGKIEQLGTQPIYMTNIAMEKTGTGTITLNEPVSIIGNATFITGNIMSSKVNSLIFLDSATQTGASEVSFVAGPVTKIGKEAFSFPSGIYNLFAPINITAPTSASDRFMAQYFHTNANDSGYNTSQHDSTLNHISQKEFWLLERINGAASPKVTLSWNANRSGTIDAMADLRVAHWNGSIWKDEGNGAATGTNDEGTVQSLNNISDFGAFTLASSSINNPLPKYFLSFTASLIANRLVLLKWETAEEVNNAQYEVERSTDGITWYKIATLLPLTSHQYQYTDNLVIEGTFYYKIKQLENNGNFEYSLIQIVQLSINANLLIWPNPVSDILIVQTKFAEGNFQITDLSGRTLLNGLIQNNITKVPVEQLAKGLYVLKILQNGNLFTANFIKR